MAGNSWLAVCQINFASKLSHPALKALAPWEGFSDVYRHFVSCGGFPSHQDFVNAIYSGVLSGSKEAEDLRAMLAKRPLFDEYWADKVCQLENIDVPLYIVAGYVSFHCNGSFATFIRAKTKQKFMRVTPFMEWYETYRVESNDDLQRFFDRYCKGIMNGWELDTSPVRLSLFGYEGSVPTVMDRPEQDYPLDRQHLKTLYLDAASKTLTFEKPTDVSSISHESHSFSESSDFTVSFSEYTEIAGYAKARLWMSCKEKDDMDVVVQIRKIGKDGNPMVQLNYPVPIPVEDLPNNAHLKYLGPQGFLRASHAETRDDSQSSSDGQRVFYRHDAQKKIPPGTIVCLEITLWPMGVFFDKGEGIMFRVAGHGLDLSMMPTPHDSPQDENIGKHIIHTGGRYDSCVIIPVINSSRP